MDFIVLYITNMLMKYSAKFIRLLLSATLGAVWSVVCVLIPDSFTLPEKIATYLIITPLMVRLIMGDRAGNCKDKWILFRRLLKGSITMLTVTFVMAGVLSFVRNTFASYLIANVFLSDGQLLAFTMISTIVVILIIKYEQETKLRNMLKRRIVLEICGERIELMAIIDSGNCLMDGITNRPVTVVERNRFDNILRDIDNLYKLQYHYVPFNSVGRSEGMLEVITAEKMHIYDGDEIKNYTNVAIGLSRSPITGDGEYEALLNVAYHK